MQVWVCNACVTTQKCPLAPLPERPPPGNAPHLPSSGTASCFSMGERPGWASTWVEPLLRPTVAGHGLPADSPRGDTLLPQGTVDAMRSQSWKTRCKAAFEAYSALLLRQGWEPDASTGSLWGDLRAGPFPKGWNHDDFNEELFRHGCKHDFASAWFVANLHERRNLIAFRASSRISPSPVASRKMPKERVDSSGSWTDACGRTSRC